MTAVASTSTTPSTLPNTPKSYLSAKEREELLRRNNMNFVYACESQCARKAGDEETAWRWLALTKAPAHALMFLKLTRGAQFIRDHQFDTRTAEAAYGKNWLDE